MITTKSRKQKFLIMQSFIYNGKKLDVVSDADLQADNGYVRLISNNGRKYIRYRYNQRL